MEWIKAWLIEERGTQYDLTGEAHTKTVERKSFFRRLYEYKARAAEFWLSVSRPGQAARLWQAHNQLWQEYNEGMGSPEPSNIRPTHARITSRAQSIAYKNAGEPDVETDTQIDWEDVLVFRKPDGRECGCGATHGEKACMGRNALEPSYTMSGAPWTDEKCLAISVSDICEIREVAPVLLRGHGNE